MIEMAVEGEGLEAILRSMEREPAIEVIGPATVSTPRTS
jgi:hypothetical protein